MANKRPHLLTQQHQAPDTPVQQRQLSKAWHKLSSANNTLIARQEASVANNNENVISSASWDGSSQRMGGTAAEREDESEDGRASPVFKSQRVCLQNRRNKCRKNIIGSDLDHHKHYTVLPTEMSRAEDDSDVFISPVRNAGSQVHETGFPSCPVKTTNLTESPRSVFLNREDSLDNIDFDELETICGVMESTPKQVKQKGTEASPLSISIPNLNYSLCQTPQRLKQTVPSDQEAILKRSYSLSRKQLYSRLGDHESKRYSIKKTNVVSGVSRGIGAGRDGSQHQNISTVPNENSPDLFDDNLFGCKKLLDSDDAGKHETGRSGEGSKRSMGGGGSQASRSTLPASLPRSLSLDASLRHSQFSLASTLTSQPLIHRLQNRLVGDSSSQSLVVKSEAECRAEVVAAALKEVVEAHQTDPHFELGPFFGLPSKVAQLLKSHRGINSLYEWQEECVVQGSAGGNMLVSLPTSGGKTLVVELLMLQQVLLKHRDVIFVLPYVALVQEKVRGLAPFGVELDFLVEQYAGSRGSFPPRANRRKRVIYVATTEKASGLVNSLLEAGRAGELGLVVVDEVHMLAEGGGRGATMESLITKLRFAAPKVQLVAMSATVGNLEELAAFMDASLYTGTFRPVQLLEYIKIEEYIWEVNTAAKATDELLKGQRLFCYPYSEEQKKLDGDMVGGLVGEVVPKHSCLVFCPTRRSCESLAQLLVQVLPSSLKQVKRQEKMSLYRALVEEGQGAVCPVLRKTLPYGVAYHHSGLTEGERKLVEEGYLAGTLCCLCCTSTLAAGVNLPARRVIIRSPYTGRDFLTRARYKQMVGRAGRAGFDVAGESFLVLQHQHLQQAENLFMSRVEMCHSTLQEREDHGLKSLLFSSIGLGIATSLPRLRELTGFTLLALQSSQSIDLAQKVSVIVEGLRQLDLVRIKQQTQAEGQQLGDKKKQKSASGSGLIVSQQSEVAGAGGGEEAVLDRPVTEEDLLVVTRLGNAAIKGNIDLNMANRVYRDLCVARENLALNSHLHLIYLVVPYDTISSTQVTPHIYYKAYMELGEEQLKVARLLGITEHVIVKLSVGHRISQVEESVLHRFYVALLLHRIWCGMGVWQASDKFQVHRGFTQQTLSAAAAFASCIYHFCQELEELWAFRDLLANFTRQLSGCCSAELLPLMDIPTVKMGRARLLFQAGYHTVKDVANADPRELVRSVEHLPYRTAVHIINSSKMILIERIESLQIEAEEVMVGLQYNSTPRVAARQPR